jgi:antitoxin Phd
MTAEQYDRLRAADDPRRVYAAGETPRELADAFASELARLAQGEGYDQGGGDRLKPMEGRSVRG